MFGLSGTEIVIILVVALLVLGPKKLPDLARTVGKGLREFRRATDGIRTTVEGEFYKMDQEVSTNIPLGPPPELRPAPPQPGAAPPTVSEAAPTEKTPALPADLAPPAADKK